MHKGLVAWFSGPKSYGFIAPDDEDEDDIFVHFSSIDPEAMPGYRTLKQGQRVGYEIAEGPKGKPQAVNVRVIN